MIRIISLLRLLTCQASQGRHLHHYCLHLSWRCWRCLCSPWRKMKIILILFFLLENLHLGCSDCCYYYLCYCWCWLFKAVRDIPSCPPGKLRCTKWEYWEPHVNTLTTFLRESPRQPRSWWSWRRWSRPGCRPCSDSCESSSFSGWFLETESFFFGGGILLVMWSSTSELEDDLDKQHLKNPGPWAKVAQIERGLNGQSQ